MQRKYDLRFLKLLLFLLLLIGLFCKFHFGMRLNSNLIIRSNIGVFFTFLAVVIFTA